jgi:hypothetical protein
MSMSDEERIELLRELETLAPDADLADHELQTEHLETFLPLPEHLLVMRPEIMVVRGERGVGKTHLFHVLSRLPSSLRVAVWKWNDIGGGADWISGFSESEKEHPHVASLDALGQKASFEELRALWIVHLVGRLAEQDLGQTQPMPSVLHEAWHAHRNEPEVWAKLGSGHLGEALRWLDELERELDRRDRSVVVLYDHLDRIGLVAPEIRRRYVGALLALWMSLSQRYRKICTKIFIREDVFEQAQQFFADASKLESRSVSLEWSTQSLYRMLIRHMARRTRLRAWLMRGPHAIPLYEHESLGWLPPEMLPEHGQVSQKSLVDHLAGERMGRGVKKGYTYRWIPNHLQDAHQRVVPRSLINLVGLAAREALRRAPAAVDDKLLSPAELQSALEGASLRRVRELGEEHMVVARLQNLQGLTLMLDAREACRWLAAKPEGGGDDGFGDDGAAVVAELLRLGVLRRRPDGRIDVPDLYRFGYHIKRRGGVRQPR